VIKAGNSKSFSWHTLESDPMRILFYPPFKPLDHPQPSGDWVTATGMYDFLVRQGHGVQVVSSLRTRWIFWKPWLWIPLIRERRSARRQIAEFRPQLWLTYHTYYKAPDLLGPAACRQASLPYVVFQGCYSTKRKRDWRTWPGYVMNKRALLAARLVLSNRCEDMRNLRRLLPGNRLAYVAPGIHPEDFSFDAAARRTLRRAWKVGAGPVVLSAAMFRPDVKTEGLAWVIRACGELSRRGKALYLVIAGDGQEKTRLQRLADEELPGRTRFVGKVPRGEMHRFYSAGDLFAFPGIRESLGMVYLEAQSCGLPVVAFANGGIPEVVRNRETGFLLPPFAFEPYLQALGLLLSDEELRCKMGQEAQKYVRRKHDLDQNYRRLEAALTGVVGGLSPERHAGAEAR
jgi:glycosyltransferase involved in cell wall biosynthesis